MKQLIFFLGLILPSALLSVPSQTKLDALYHSIDPFSLSKHLAFYSLYPELPQGQKALDHALYLLSKETGGIPVTKDLPAFPEGIEAVVALVTKPEKDAVPLIEASQWECIESFASHLPHRKLRGHGVESEEEVLALAADEVDLAHGWMLSQFPGSDSETIQRRRSYEALLDLMALQILARVSLASSPLEKVHAINRFVFEEMGFRFPPQSQFSKDIDQYTFLSSVLDSREGVCLGVSILYICLAQRLGLSMEMVTPPGHIYVRYNGPEGIINIETTARGIHLDSERYLSIETCQLQERNTKEMIGLAHFNQAGVYLQKGDYATALASYERARPYLPHDPLLKELMAYQLLLIGEEEAGSALLREGCMHESPYLISKETIAEDFLQGKVDAKGIEPIFCFVDEKRSSILEKKRKIEAVLDRYPEFRAGIFQLGITWLQLHRDREAYATFQRYHCLDPNHAAVEYYLSMLAWKRKEYERAWEYLNQAISLTSKRSHFPRVLHDLQREFSTICPKKLY